MFGWQISQTATDRERVGIIEGQNPAKKYIATKEGQIRALKEEWQSLRAENAKELAQRCARRCEWG